MKVLIKVPEDSNRSEALEIYNLIEKMGHNVTILFHGTDGDMDFNLPQRIYGNPEGKGDIDIDNGQ